MKRIETPIEDDVEDDYANLTPLDWVMYEFATIQYDFNVHPKAAERIISLFERLYRDALQ